MRITNGQNVRMKYQNLTRLSNINALGINGSSNGIIIRLVKKSTLYLNFMKFMCTETNEVDDTKNLNSKKRVEKQTYRPRKTNLHLINPKVAKQIVLLIKDDLLRNATHVVESNPGPGLLTRELLEAGVPFIHLYERKEEYVKQLQVLQNEFPNRISIENIDLFKVAKAPLTHNNHRDISIFDVFKKIQAKKWEEASSLQVIGIISDTTFMKHLILSTVFQTCFMMYGRATFYAAIPAHLFSHYADYNPKTLPCILFKILFNCENFGRISRTAYAPWPKKKKIMANKTHLWYHVQHLDMLYVIKLEPKPDIFKLFNGKEDLVYFWYFLRHIMYRPSARVIATFEKIIPGCGVRLIGKDYNIFTQFSDLTVNQIYELFIEFKSWPETADSMFIENLNDIRKSHTLYIEKEYESIDNEDYGCDD